MKLFKREKQQAVEQATLDDLVKRIERLELMNKLSNKVEEPGEQQMDIEEMIELSQTEPIAVKVYLDRKGLSYASNIASMCAKIFYMLDNKAFPTQNNMQLRVSNAVATFIDTYQQQLLDSAAISTWLTKTTSVPFKPSTVGIILFLKMTTGEGMNKESARIWATSKFVPSFNNHGFDRDFLPYVHKNEMQSAFGYWRGLELEFNPSGILLLMDDKECWAEMVPWSLEKMSEVTHGNA